MDTKVIIKSHNQFTGAWNNIAFGVLYTLMYVQNIADKHFEIFVNVQIVNLQV